MIYKNTILIISGTLLALGNIPPILYWPKTTIEKTPLVLVPYVSPTLNKDPLKEYNDRSMQQMMDQILIDSMNTP